MPTITSTYRLPAPLSSAGGAPDDAIHVTLQLYEHFTQIADFGGAHLPILSLDEPAPVGDGHGPDPTRLLAAAIGGCLASSLLYCLQRAHISVLGLRTRVDGTCTRTPAGRPRIAGYAVSITPTVAAEDLPRLADCIAHFEEYCTVTEAVRAGLDVAVRVAPVAAARPAAH